MLQMKSLMRGWPTAVGRLSPSTTFALPSNTFIISCRGVAHGGGQGDQTRHKKSRPERLKYSEIPRIPGVTYMPGELQLGSSENNPVRSGSGSGSGPEAGQAAQASISGAPPVNPEFVNRNPRNLEMMNIAVRRAGWQLEAERKDFYNKIEFERTAFHTRASILHTSGRVVVSVSTEEFAVSKFLYRTTDVSAARNVGRILGRRMLETGIVAVYCPFEEEERKGNRLAVFLQALTDSGIQLQEGEQIKTPDPYTSPDFRRLK